MATSASAAVGMSHPPRVLHVRLVRCEGLRSRRGAQSLEPFVVAQMHRARDGPVPPLHRLSATPPASSAHFVSGRAGETNAPVWHADTSFTFTDWTDELSLLIVDASATGSDRLVGGLCLPLTILQEKHVDRWFDLVLPAPPLAPQHQQLNPLAAWCPDTKPTDAILQIAPASSANPIGRIRLQMFHVLAPHAPATASIPRLSLSSFPEELQSLRIKVITINCGNAALPDDLAPLLPSDEPMPDLIAIGLQECAYDAATLRDISGAPLVSNGCEASIVAAFTQLLPACYQRIHIHSLWEMRLLLFIRREVRPLLSHLTFDAVATGVGNVIANKGMIVASMQLRDTRIAFVTGHLAAHTDKLTQRNKDLALVMKSVGWPWSGAEHSAASGVSQAYTDLLSSFHHVFLFGDLNYRITWPVGNTDRSPTPAAFKHVLGLVRANAWEDLEGLDQLRAQQRAGTALSGFKEGRFQFAPSFKVLRNVALGYTAKRLPSYADRILWRSVFEDPTRTTRDGEDKSSTGKQSAYALSSTGTLPAAPLSLAPQQLSLNLITGVMTSDHKPVTSSFLLPTFSLAGRGDHSRGAAALTIKQMSFSPAPSSSSAVPTASVADNMTLELRAPFLREPVTASWRERYLLADLPLPMAYNNLARVRRELLLMRVFKPQSLAGHIASTAMPLARGCAVLTLSSTPNQDESGHIVEHFDLTVQLTSSGVLFGHVTARIIIRWKKLSTVKEPASSPSAAKHSASLRPLSIGDLLTDDEDDDEEDDEGAPDTSPFALPVLAQTAPARSMLVALQSPSMPAFGSIAHETARPKRNGTVGHLLSTMDSLSVTQRLQREQRTIENKSTSSGAHPTASATTSRSLATLVTLCAASEAAYSNALHVLVHQYYRPISQVVLAQDKQRGASDDWNATPSAALASIFSNLPILATVHAAMYNELEAQLRILNFGAARPLASPTGRSTRAADVSPFPSQPLQNLGELLLHFMPLFSVYRWTLHAFNSLDPFSLDGASHHTSAHRVSSGDVTPKERALSTIRELIARIDATRARSTSTSVLDFQALLSLPIQRVASYHLLCREVLRLLQRTPVSSPSDLALRRLYTDLIARFDRLQSQMSAFQSWYSSLALERQADEEAQLYAQLAGEDVAQWDDSNQRISTAAVIRPGTAYHPLATGFRPATAYGGGDIDELSHSRADSATSGSIPSAQLHMLTSKIQAQLKSRVTLAGFHAHTPAAYTQEDITLEYRGSSRKAPSITPRRARAMSLSGLDLFTSRSDDAHAHLLLSSSPVGHEQSYSKHAYQWSLEQVSQQLGVGSTTATAQSAAHWSSILPPAFRKLQAGRSLIQLIDARGSLLINTVASGRPSPINSDSEEYYSADDFEHEEEETDQQDGTHQDEEDDLDEMSLASEQMQKIMQVAARAKPAGATVSSVARPSPSSSSQVRPPSATRISVTPVASASSVAPTSIRRPLSGVTAAAPTSPRPRPTRVLAPIAPLVAPFSARTASTSSAASSFAQPKPSSAFGNSSSIVRPLPLARTTLRAGIGGVAGGASSARSPTPNDELPASAAFTMRMKQPTTRKPF